MAVAVDVPRHPARFPAAVLAVIAETLDAEARRRNEARMLSVLDPFAGVGGIHAVQDDEMCGVASVVTVGVEIEKEWAQAHPRTLVGDALDLASVVYDSRFDVIATSPCYGNRMADCHDARDDSRRNTYRHALGRPLSEASSGSMQWGPKYRTFHEQAWAEAHRVLAPGGLVILNVSNHIRGGVEQRVVEFHLNAWLRLGCTLVEARRVATRRLRFGENHEARVDGELVLVLRKPVPA